MRCSTAIHACTPGNHGNNQSKEKGRWNGQLYRPDPPQEKGVLVYQEAQTFARKQAAQAWAKRRETELAEHGAIERANRGGHAIKDMIDRYLVEAEKARPLGKTKRQTRLVLLSGASGSIRRCEISQVLVIEGDKPGSHLG